MSKSWTGRSLIWVRWGGLAAVLSALILACDLVVPSELASAVAYVAVILIGAWMPDRRFVFTLAAGASILIVLGFILADDLGSPVIALANRVAALAAVWVTAFAIFQRRRVQDRLVESERWIRSAIDNAVDGIVTINENGIIQSFNRAAEEMFGYRSEEVLGRNISILMPPQDAKQHDTHVRRYLDTKRSGIIGVGPREVMAKRKDGSNFPLELAIGEVAEGGTRLFIGSLRDITNRREMEREAEEKSALLQAVFETMAQGFTVVDSKGRLMAFNHQYEKLIGYPPGFLRRGMPLEDMIRYRAAQGHLGNGDPDDLVRDRVDIIREGVEAVRSRTLPNGTSYIYHRKRLPGGGIVTTFTDLTEQKEAERKIAAQSALLQVTFENMSQGIAVFDRDWKLAAFNPQYAEILDYPPNFLRLGMDRQELIRFRGERGELGEGDMDALVAAKVGESSRPRVTERTLANGRTFMYERTPLPDGGFISTATNITERKQAERELADQSALLQATFENISQGFAVFDRDHVLIAVNSHFAEILKLPSERLKPGCHRRDVIRWQWERGHHGDSDLESVTQERLARSFESRTGERTLDDGTTYFYTHKPTADGGYIITLSDVTEWRKTETQLHQAQKMEAVGQLTGGIAHDFNNLLAVSLGNLELALEVFDQGGDVRTLLRTAKGATERGAALTNQLMAFGRRQALQPEVTDAGELTAELGDFIRRVLSAAIELEVVADDDLWPVLVDRNQLQSAILNLIVNARDAMADGGKITIRVRNEDLTPSALVGKDHQDPGAYVLIAVSDTGPGMSPEVRDHAFEPFFTTKGVGEGSGLGLSMVYGFAKQSGGFADIESIDGVGTTVSIFLPRREADAGSPVRVPDERAWPDGERSASNRERILLVEDDEDVRETTAAMLTSAGYDVVAVENGPKALTTMADAGNADIALVLTDIVLTGPMNGLEVAERLLARHPGLSFVFMTGYADLDSAAQPELVSRGALIRKPFTKAQLVDFLEKARKLKAA